MVINSKQILKVLNVLSWIIFIGVCIEAGGYIFNTFFVFFINPVGANSFWNKIDFSSLYQYDSGYFLVVTLLMIIVAVMKALMFYLIVKILHENKLNMSQPFNKEVVRFIFNLSYLVTAIGLFSNWGAEYSKWMVSKGIQMPDIQRLGFGGADVWLFIAVILFVIANIFKRGIEIQIENELTI